MKQFRGFDFFNGMPDGMAKIQQGTFSLFCRIFFYDCALNTTAFLNHLQQNRKFPVIDLHHMINQPFIVARILNQTMFQNLTHAAGELLCIQSFQSVQIHINQGRLMKSTNHIFVTVKIYSCFSTNTAIYLR